MSTDTVLTDEQIGAIFDAEADNPTHQAGWKLFDLARAIEQAVLQSPEIQALRKDAERYRWLRMQRTISDHACVTWNIGHDWVQMDGAELDAAIDHARRIEGDGK